MIFTDASCLISWLLAIWNWNRIMMASFWLHRLPLYRILTMDGLIEDIKRRRYYEKPCRRRQRESYENCRRIYNMEMTRKVNFLMRKNRADPWQGCWGLWTRGPVRTPSSRVATSFLSPTPFSLTFLAINSIADVKEGLHLWNNLTNQRWTLEGFY